MHASPLFTAAALLLLALIPVLLVAYRGYHSLQARRRTWFGRGLISIVCIEVSCILILILQAVRRPPDFDFVIFWINGQMAAHGMNFYDSYLANALAQPFHPSETFQVESLNRPFLYPPPTIWLFMPLGWFSLRNAALVWYTLQIFCLFASVVLLSRIFFQDKTLQGYLVTGILLMSMYGTYSNIKTAQTLFLVLLFMALFFRDQNGFRGGVWLGTCILLKPFAAMLLIYCAFRKKWRALGGALAADAVATLVTLAVCGPSVFKSYFLEMNYAGLPRSLYREPQNQSLLAWTIRVVGDSRAAITVFMLLATIMAGITLFRMFHLLAEGDNVAFASTLTLALLLYPASLRSYSVLLVIPVLLLFRRNLLLPIAVAYGLMTIGGGYFVGFASALLWLVFSGVKAEEHQTVLVTA